MPKSKTTAAPARTRSASALAREAAWNAALEWAKSAEVEAVKHAPVAVDGLRRLAGSIRACGVDPNAPNPLRSARDAAWNAVIDVWHPLNVRRTEPREMPYTRPDGSINLERASNSFRALNADERGAIRSVCGPLVDAATACQNSIGEVPDGDRQGTLAPDLAERIDRAAALLSDAAGVARVPMPRIPRLPGEVQHFVVRRDLDDDPILCARMWIDGYEFRLGEADRARHLPGATAETYPRMLAWADDPKRDRCHEAIEVLLGRIRNHPRPPYTPEVLLGEFESLRRIPVAERLAQRYPERFLAWIDRVETFLALNAAGVDDKIESGAAADDDIVTLDQAAAKVRKSKRTLEKLADLPKPDYPAKRRGQAHSWRWATLLPCLRAHFRADLPDRFSGSR